MSTAALIGKNFALLEKHADRIEAAYPDRSFDTSGLDDSDIEDLLRESIIVQTSNGYELSATTAEYISDFNADFEAPKP